MRSYREEVLLLMVSLALTVQQVASKIVNSEFAEVLHRPIRDIMAFPDESTFALFFALAVPLEDPYKSVSIADFFEATYNLPVNVSDPWFDAEAGRRKRRSLNRETLYQLVENKFINYGYQGHECLLRAICETSEHSLRHNGLIGDILHVIFTPTTSRHEPLPQDILQAEVVGRNGSCSNYQPQCPVGLFDLIGVFG
ncbi:uncharacterized protein LOC114873798 [Osmia bicornis bicornis]|uniref:uncharacterized protein LOC114873798 n=1 Tax=Osmia bicornis bicornis TaxID=1437191 RepID=UPI0010F9891B|nr:uncharacterized protein LOC114873798 [Osmia bicornis bicornis]